MQGSVETPTCPEAYAKRHSPTEKQATDITRNIKGDRLIQIKTHQGTRCPGERLMMKGKSEPQEQCAKILTTSLASTSDPANYLQQPQC
jgi:hypothetical protein